MDSQKSNLVKVRVYHEVSQGIPSLMIEKILPISYDNNWNVTIEDKDINFKEDFEFKKDAQLNNLIFALKLDGKKKSRQGEILDNAIKEQKEILHKFEEDPENMNKKYNFQDEHLRLKQYRVLKDELLKTNKGSYMRIEKGIKTYEFMNDEGILYPYWFGTSPYRIVVDFSVKKKIYNSELTILNKQNDFLNQFAQWGNVILIGILVIGIIGNMFWTYHNYSKSAEFEIKISQAGIDCNNAMSSMVKNYGGIVEDYIKVKKQEISEIEKQNKINSEKQNEKIGYDIK